MIYLLAAALLSAMALVVVGRVVLALLLVRLDNWRHRVAGRALPLRSYTPQTIDRFRTRWFGRRGGAL